jgi:hypothetical protein
MQEEKMPRDEIKAIIEEGQVDPSRDIDEIIKKARHRKKVERRITLLVDEDEQLKKYATDQEVSEDEALSHLVQLIINKLNEDKSSL